MTRARTLTAPGGYEQRPPPRRAVPPRRRPGSQRRPCDAGGDLGEPSGALAPLQLELPVEGNDPVRPGTPAGATRLAAEEALDRVRERFGKTAAGRASLLLDKDQKLVPDEFRHLAERDR